MPALSLCGRLFLLAADDFWMFMWMFVPLHLVWAYLDVSRIFAEGLTLLNISPLVLYIDAVVCLLCVPLDVVICICSADGAIMRRRRCESFFKCLLFLRILLAVAHFLTYASILVPAMMFVIEQRETVTEHLTDISGWGPLAEEKWALLVVWLNLAIRCLLYASLIGVEALLLLPKSLHQFVVGKAAYWLLRIVGAGDAFFWKLSELMMEDVIRNITLEKFAPTDLIYGLLLVAARQSQGFLGFDPDEEEVALPEESARLLEETGREQAIECKLPKSIHRATQLSGVERPLTPFSARREVDQVAMREIEHLRPFASGIYGPVLFGLPSKGFEPGTMIPSYACSAMCCSLPCFQRLPAGSKATEYIRRQCCCISCCLCCRNQFTEGDWSWGANEDFLRSSVAEQAKRAGQTEPELVWASWNNFGPERALPMAVLLDHAHRQLVVTIRGTADVKDIVNDAGIFPEHFDPLGMGGSRTEQPFDQEKDLFVPHTWLAISQDCIRQLEERGILETALKNEGKAFGYRVMVTGHSLGSAIACLVAFQLQAKLGKEHRVRYVGFETPGCVLSKRLARKTQSLGWISVVCGHDWVPRLSIRNAQKLLEGALDELERCDRSKLQLSLLFTGGAIKQIPCLCCVRRPLSALYTLLGGGPLDRTYCCGYRNLEPLGIERPGLTFPEMFPAGDIVYLKPLVSEWRCCCFQKDTEWSAEWADPADVQQEFILASRVIELHVPWVYEDAIQRVGDRLRNSPGAPQVKAFAEPPPEGGWRPCA